MSFIQILLVSLYAALTVAYQQYLGYYDNPVQHPFFRSVVPYRGDPYSSSYGEAMMMETRRNNPLKQENRLYFPTSITFPTMTRIHSSPIF